MQFQRLGHAYRDFEGARHGNAIGLKTQLPKDPRALRLESGSLPTQLWSFSQASALLAVVHGTKGYLQAASPQLAAALQRERVSVSRLGSSPLTSLLRHEWDLGHIDTVFVRI